MKYMNIKLFTVISTLIVSSSTYSSSLSKCLSTMTGEPGKPGPMGIYKPGFNTYTTKQNNLTFGGKTYSTYMDLCKDIKDDKEKIVGFLKQKDQELKKYQDSDVDYKKRKIEHEKAEADYRAQQEFRDTERAAMSEYHQALEDGSVNEEYAQERMKSKIEAADAELKAKQDLNSQYYEIDQDSLDKTLTERFGQERKPGDTLENTVGTDFRNEQRNDIQAKILGFGDADASNFGDNSDDNNDLTDENSPLTAPRTPEQICQDEENRGNNVEEGDIKVTCTTDGKVQKDSPTPDTNTQGENLNSAIAECKESYQQNVVRKYADKMPNMETEEGQKKLQDIFVKHENEISTICNKDSVEGINADKATITLIGNEIDAVTEEVASNDNENNNECVDGKDKNGENCTPSETLAGASDNLDENQSQGPGKHCNSKLPTISSNISTIDMNLLNKCAQHCECYIDTEVEVSNISSVILKFEEHNLENIKDGSSLKFTGKIENGKIVSMRNNNGNTRFEHTDIDAHLSTQLGSYIYNMLENSYSKIHSEGATSEVTYYGSESFKQCQAALGGVRWEEVYRDKSTYLKSMVTTMAEAELFRALDVESHSFDKDSLGDLKQKYYIGYNARKLSLRNRAISRSKKRAQQCIVFVNVLEDNFKNEKVHKDSDYTSSDSTETASMDGRLKCQTDSVEVIDYDECSKIVTTYNAALIGKKGLEVVQSVQTQEATFDGNQRMQEAQINAVNNIRNGTDTNNPMQRQVNGQMAAYEVQKDMINKQKSQAQTRAAIDTATAASLVAFAQSMPGPNDLVKMCSSKKDTKEIYNSSISSLDTKFKAESFLPKTEDSSQTGDATVDHYSYKISKLEDTCSNFISNEVHNFIPNKLISQPVYAIAAEFGVEAAKNQLSASMLKKRAGMIDDLMERIKNMDTGGEYAGLTQQEAIMKYCEANPSSAQCAALPGGTGTTIINPGGFNLGGEDFAANGLEGYDVEDFGEDLDTVSEIDENGDGDGSTGPTSTKVADVNKNGEKGAIAPRAKIGNGGGRGPASGGGAGGAASAGNRGGGGAPEGEKGKGQASGQAKNTSLAYNSGKNNAYLKGGGSINSRSNKKVANPFAKLFKNSKGKVLNFRGPSSIGKQSGNLFTRISKRYGNVHENNRLLKYKYTPAK